MLRNRINVNSRSDVMSRFSKHRHYTFVGLVQQKSDDHPPSFWSHHKPLFMFRKYNSLFMFKRHKYWQEILQESKSKLVETSVVPSASDLMLLKFS